MGKIIRRQVKLITQSSASTEILIADIVKWLGIDDKATYNRIVLHCSVALEYADRDDIIDFVIHPSYGNFHRSHKRYSNLFGNAPPVLTLPLAASENPVTGRQLSVEDLGWTAGTVKMLCTVEAELIEGETLPPDLP